MDEAGIRELAESMKRVGLIEPLIVEKIEGGYEVIAGHRRLLAAREAGLNNLQCMVREADDPPAAALKVQENLYREDMTPVEEAAFYAELFESCGKDVDQVCAMVHQTRNYVEKRLLLLSGDRAVLQALVDKSIALGVAEEINKIAREDDRHYFLDWAIRVGATVKTVRDWRMGNEIRRAAEEGATPYTAGEPAPAAPDPEPTRCLFCESNDDQHMMKFAMVHTYCLRRAEEDWAGMENVEGDR
jgi:ParB/RepB/Spo0J family partition protein